MNEPDNETAAPPSPRTATALIAEPWRPNAMGSFGDAMYMILGQYRFPLHYDPERETVQVVDSDRVGPLHLSECYARHLKPLDEERSLGALHQAIPQLPGPVLVAYAVDVVKADPKRTWTGARVLGSVNRGNGYPVYSFEVFARDPEGDTQVFSGRTASNVQAGGWDGYGYRPPVLRNPAPWWGD